MRPEEREELLTAYALGTLSEPDAAVVRELVRSDSSAAAELSEYHEILDLIALSVPLRRADPALRTRVLEAARRERAGGSRRLRLRRVLPWVAAAAVIALALSWGANLQQELQALRQDNAALTAVVEAGAKRLESLMEIDGDLSSQALALRFESTTAEFQLALAVSTAPDMSSSPLIATDAGHGAGGHFLWSSDVGAGWLTTHGLPPLPLGQVYEVWLHDGERAVSGGTFLPDEAGSIESVVRPASLIMPLRISLAVASEGGSETIGSPIVLGGTIAQ